MIDQDRHSELSSNHRRKTSFFNRYVYLLTVPICILAFITGLGIYFSGEKVAGLGAVIYSIASGLLLLVWQWKRNVTLWCRCYLFNWLIFSGIISLFSGGLNSSVAFVYSPFPLIACIFLKKNEVIFWTSMLFLVVFGLYCSNIFGWLAPYDPSTFAHYTGHIVYILASSCVVLTVAFVQAEKSNEREELLELEITKRAKVESDLVRQTKKLTESNKELERFAVVAAHDLQEPLRMIGSYVQLLSKKHKGKLDPETDEYIDFAVEGAAKMKNQMNALLEYGRLSENNFTKKELDSKDLVKSAISNLHLLINESKAEIKLEGDFPLIEVNPNQFVSVFQSLIHNSIRFRGKTPPIVKISAITLENEFVFCVEDNGMGIAKRHQLSIFDLFQRLQSRSEYEGLGVGLSITKKLIENHDGKIWVESDEGKGSKFFFSIPQTEKEHYQKVSG